jgi:hypothetical protein
MPEERRAKLREAHRKRLGNKPGHHRVYDVQVPDQLWPDIKKFAAQLRRDKVDLVTVNMIIRLLVQQRWLLQDREARLRFAAALVSLPFIDMPIEA